MRYVHEIFIWRVTPVLFFSKKLSRYQNSEILWCLNISPLSNLYTYLYVYQVTLSLTWIGISFFRDCFYITLLIIIFIIECLMSDIKSAIPFAIWRRGCMPWILTGQNIFVNFSQNSINILLLFVIWTFHEGEHTLRILVKFI